MAPRVYYKGGAECFVSSGVPTNNNLDTNIAQVIAVAEWEMEYFEGQVSVDVAKAMLNTIKKLHTSRNYFLLDKAAGID